MTRPRHTGKVPTASTGSEQHANGIDQGMRVLAYLISGLVFYGGLGWLADWYLGTRFLFPIGMVLGMALSVYLIIKRFGQVHQ